MHIPPNLASTSAYNLHLRPTRPLAPGGVLADKAAPVAAETTRPTAPPPVRPLTRPLGTAFDAAMPRPLPKTPTRPAAPAAPAVPAAPAATGDSQPVRTLEGLMQSWGKNDPAYDFNGDKTVDVEDLVHFMMHFPDAAPTQKPDSADDTKEPPKFTLEGLMESWGDQSLAKTASPYDGNGDGVVDVQDMVQFILNGPPGSAQATPNLGVNKVA